MGDAVHRQDAVVGLDYFGRGPRRIFTVLGPFVVVTVGGPVSPTAVSIMWKDGGCCRYLAMAVALAFAATLTY